MKIELEEKMKEKTKTIQFDLTPNLIEETETLEKPPLIKDLNDTPIFQ